MTQEDKDLLSKDDKVVWNHPYKGVEIRDEGEHFIIRSMIPSYYCNWEEAVRCQKDTVYYKLPTVKQLYILAKHIDKVNETIRENNGYEIQGDLWSCEENGEFSAWFVNLTYGITFGTNKDVFHYMRGVIAL